VLRIVRLGHNAAIGWSVTSPAAASPISLKAISYKAISGTRKGLRRI
jgi:hypothetical protein